MTKKIIDNLIKMHLYEELYDLYIIQNKSIIYIMQKFNLSRGTLCRILDYYNIHKVDSLKFRKAKDFNDINSISKEKLYQEYIIENKTIPQICKEYNLADWLLSKKIKEYGYGKDNKKYFLEYEIVYDLYINKGYSIKELANQLNCSKRAVEHFLWDNKITKTHEQTHQTSLRKIKEKYGVNNVSKLQEIKEKKRLTNLKRSGYDWPLQDPEYRKMMWAKQKENGTTNTSKPEDKIAAIIMQTHPDVLRNHATSQYPFHCDFYIPELDLYIEYQGDPSHGKEPYDASNPKHQKILETWQQKAHDVEVKTGKQSRYSSFIDTWTRRDPLKRQTVVANHLNWYEFFTFKEFLDWFNSL